MSATAAVSAPLTLAAAFTVGMAGSVHCLAMCGGISGALGLRARQAPRQRAGWLMAGYQAGRLTSYSMAGALVGALSGLVQDFIHLERVAVAARLLAGLLLIAVGVGALFKIRPLAALERLGGRLWRHLAPLARALPANGLAGSVLLGALWGWLPCGFVYSMLAFSALQGGALAGAAQMLFFGLGTVPAVVGAGVLSAQVGRWSMARGVNGAAGLLLLAFGLMTMLGPLNHHHH